MRKTVLVLASLALAVLLACEMTLVVALERPAQAASPGQNGKIAYRSYNRDDGGIYIINPDGSGETHVANTGGGPEVQPPGSADGVPTWSPDGTKIAFVRFTSIYDIFVTDPDGSNQTNITNTPDELESWPAWSPDGSKIVFLDQPAGEGDTSDIYVMDSDGSNRTRLTNDDVRQVYGPVWSPSGSKIAFVGRPSCYFTGEGEEQVEVCPDSEIYIINTDGTGQTNITNNLRSDADPDWSPDGTKIVFSSTRDGTRDIYVMKSDGSEVTRLTNDGFEDGGPVWSPDGTKIAFSRYLGSNNNDIYTMNTDGTGQTNITNSPAYDEYPDWQPIPVGYNFSGFYQPVDNLPTLNKTKPGKTIPVRFSLEGDKGLEIFFSGYPRSEAINCETGAPVDNIEQTELGKNGLTYDPVSDRYTYHWATSSSWSGCRQFVMTLKDGSVQRANFTFR